MKVPETIRFWRRVVGVGTDYSSYMYVFYVEGASEEGHGQKRNYL